jgi:hypothetical protein
MLRCGRAGPRCADISLRAALRAVHGEISLFFRRRQNRPVLRRSAQFSGSSRRRFANTPIPVPLCRHYLQMQGKSRYPRPGNRPSVGTGDLNVR